VQLSFIFICVLIFIIAISMTMVGKGGGNFYVLVLVLAQIPMQNAASIGQFILFAASISALFIFNKNKTLVWPLAIMIGVLIAASAFLGGYFSHYFAGYILKIVFAVLLFVSGILMLVKIKKQDNDKFNKKIGYWIFQFKEQKYSINLFVSVPIIIVTGFAAGMVGVSGGSFLVPLMVLACGLSMKNAVGTASALIAVTAFMGFMGHAIQGDVNFTYALPLAAIAIIGGVIGSKFALKSKPKNLKKLFAYTNWLAAIIMFINAITTINLK